MLARFLASYKQFRAGYPHRLIFLLKGFTEELPIGLAKMLSEVPHTKMQCPDYGFDLGSYFFGSGLVVENLVMCTNSFSVLNGDEWLLKLLNAYGRPQVGLVGASGSWESLSSYFLSQASHGPSLGCAGMLGVAKAVLVGLPLLSLFPAFPNAHLRTNGFLINRLTFLSMRPLIVRTKLDAWLFESGRYSMTRQVMKRGKEVLVVGRDGVAFQPVHWDSSQTFWQGSQDNLLIQDNRTVAYEKADERFRAVKSIAAWGPRPAFGKSGD